MNQTGKVLVQTVIKTCLIVVTLVFGGTVQAQMLPDFTVLVEENAPAIVNVSTTRRSAPDTEVNQESLDQLLRYFYGDRLPDLPMPEMQERSAMGSGFIISEDGFLVTNHHVIDGADEITITLNDQREFTAELIGSDERSDLAVLKIAATGLPIVKMGDSHDLKVGEWVLAIGSPFGLQYSVAAGIISYMGRSLPADGYVSYIQTDVAINPGHSGGPLFNLDGEVIGINSQIFTNSGGSIGLSFAIPVDVAKNVVGQLRDNGTVSRGWMGVGIENVSQELAEAFNLDTPHGALVNQVIEDSPAEKAGFRSGDIIVGYNGENIRTSSDLPFYVGLSMPGTEARIDLVRNGQPQTINMEVGNLGSQITTTAPQPEPEYNRLGLIVEELEPDVMVQLGLESGVRVLEVEGDPAREAGIMEGDIVVTINNEEISTVEEFITLTENLPSDRALPVLIARSGRQSFFTIRLSE